MSILSKYIIKQYLLNLVILFVVLTGLVILLDLIMNFDEFVDVVKQQTTGAWYAQIWQLILVISDFYWPMLFLFYTYMIGLIPIAAAGFTFGQMIRNRELVAILASGISLRRIALPIVLVTLIGQGLLIIDQQFIIPSMANKLIRKHDALAYSGGHKGFRLFLVPDGNGALFLSGTYYPGRELDILPQLSIFVREPNAPATEKIVADQGIYNHEKKGWDLVNGYAIKRLALDDKGQTQLNLGDPEPRHFFKSDLDPTTLLLRKRERLRTMLSLKDLEDLAQRADKPAKRAELQQIWHARFSLPVLNMLILLMGLPFFLHRFPGNLLTQTAKAAPLCIGAWAGGFIMLQTGISIIPPIAAAWLPVAMYLPVAYFCMDSIET